MSHCQLGFSTGPWAQYRFPNEALSSPARQCTRPALWLLASCAALEWIGCLAAPDGHVGHSLRLAPTPSPTTLADKNREREDEDEGSFSSRPDEEEERGAQAVRSHMAPFPALRSSPVAAAAAPSLGRVSGHGTYRQLGSQLSAFESISVVVYVRDSVNVNLSAAGIYSAQAFCVSMCAHQLMGGVLDSLVSSVDYSIRKKKNCSLNSYIHL